MQTVTGNLKTWVKTVSELTAKFSVQAEVTEPFVANIQIEELVAAAQAALIAEGLGEQSIGVSIEIADDDYVQRMNREYRGVDRTTDVLSFANEEAPDWAGRAGVVYQVEAEAGTEATDSDEEYDDSEDGEDEFEEYDDEADDGPGAVNFVLPPELANQSDQRYIGDIVISWPQAERQASDFANTPQREVQELVIHGIFHLLGYDHEEASDREVMRAKEEAAAHLLDQAATA